METRAALRGGDPGVGGTSIWTRLPASRSSTGRQPREGAREAAVGAAIVGRLVHGTVVSRGEGRGEALLREIDTWRVRGWPRRWPRPRPNGWDDALMFAGAGRYAAHLATRYGEDPELGTALRLAAGRLLDTSP